jgi:hypothetical protein
VTWAANWGAEGDVELGGHVHQVGLHGPPRDVLPCEGVSPGGLLDSRNRHGVEVHPLKASSVGGSMEQAGGRSTPGEVGDFRLASFGSDNPAPARRRPAVPAGAGGQHMFAGDRLAPVL